MNAKKKKKEEDVQYKRKAENYYYNILLHTLAHLFQRGHHTYMYTAFGLTTEKCVKLSAKRIQRR